MNTVVMLLLFIFLTPLAFATTNGSVICTQPYAICASAPCMPIPGNMRSALCSCKVETGASFGNTSCNYRKSQKVAYGLTQIISTYSFAEAKTNPVMSCPAGTPWTNCLDAKCIIDPNAPGRAVCTCKVVTIGKYVTYGGNCNTDSCKTFLWSGATNKAFLQGSQALIDFLKIKKLPYQRCDQ